MILAKASGRTRPESGPAATGAKCAKFGRADRNLSACEKTERTKAHCRAMVLRP
jgi:hypothetical protein